MNDKSSDVCRFCLETVNKGEWDKIKETSKQMLNVLLLKSKAINEENVICRECANKLQNAVHFKTTCLDSENKIVPHLNAEEDPKSFKHDSLNENASVESINDSDGRMICRFCKQLKEYECHSYLDERKENIFIVDMAHMYIPELHPSVTKELITCKNCLNSLQSLLNFVISYSGAEEKIIINDQRHIKVKLELDNIEGSTLENEVISNKVDIIKIEENHIKSEDVTAVKDADEYEYDVDDLNIKSEETELKSEEYHSKKCQENTKGSETKYHTLYKCEICSYKTKRKDNLRRHMLIHKDHVDVTMHKCEECSFETKHKVSLTRHMVMHENPSAFRCEICSLLLKSQTNLIKHVLTHKSPSEIDMFHCDSCSYQTKHKNCLIRHMLTHQSASDLIMYKCDKCTFETRHKGSYKYHKQTHQGSARIIYKCERCSFESKVKYTYIRHLLIHDKPSEVKMYKCEICPFKTRHRHGIYVHRLTHKSPSEVKMYYCEKCSFKTKYSGNLKQHRQTHESSSEIKKYKCEKCSYETRLRSSLIRHTQIHQNTPEVRIVKGLD